MTDNMLTLPWNDYNPDLDAAVGKAVEALMDAYHSKKTRLPKSQEQKLQQDMKNAQMARRNAGQMLRAFAKAIRVNDVESSIRIAPMKDWARAVAKQSAQESEIFDLGRGRLLIETVGEYLDAKRLLTEKGSKKDRSCIEKFGSVVSGSHEDFFSSARKSGFSGMMNFDCEINLRLNRIGKFEVQIMPRIYDGEVDKHSHSLYKIIRILQNVPDSYKTEEDKKIEWALLSANKAFYVEYGMRTGFIAVREDNWLLSISAEEAREICDILERLANKIETLPGRRFAWIQQTCEAMTYAKTSVHNIAKSNKKRMQTDYNNHRRKFGLV